MGTNINLVLTLITETGVVDENLNKIMFDRQINASRNSIENVLGILKNRWRILHYIDVLIKLQEL
jgi:hypothetical protein